MELWDMTLSELILMMERTESQRLKNRIALEITYRMYVPFKNKTFEELLVQNGYKIIDKTKGNEK